MKSMHNEHVAGLYRAIALRFYSRFAEMRDAAELYGGTIPGFEQRSPREDHDIYKAAVEEWIHEPPASAHAGCALAHFVGVLAADRLTGEVLLDPVDDERDAYFQSVALTGIVQWLNNKSIGEVIDQEREAATERVRSRIQEMVDKLAANNPNLSEGERREIVDRFVEIAQGPEVRS